VTLGLFASSARADTPQPGDYAGLPSGGAGGEDYGAWFPAAGAPGGASHYQAAVEPFNTEKQAAEISTFSCVFPADPGNPPVANQDTGRPVATWEQDVLKQVFDKAGAIYLGTNGEEWKGQKGRQGMQSYLREVKQSITDGKFQQGKDFGVNLDLSGLSVQGDTTHNIPPSRQLATMINVNAADPLQLRRGVPQGCALDPVDIPSLHFGDLLEAPDKFFTNLIFLFPQKATSSLYEATGSAAFKFGFWTPHSERGDTLLNTATTCPAPDRRGNLDPNSVNALKQGCTDSAHALAPLGFNKNHFDTRQQTAWYLDLAHFMQWLVSGFFFLVLFAAAIVYMVRGNASTSFNVIRLIPRLIGAVILTLFAPFLIGAAISFSNLLVSTLFDSSAGPGVTGAHDWSVGAVHATIAAISGYSANTNPTAVSDPLGLSVGGLVGDNFGLHLLTLISAGYAVWSFVLILGIAIIRQLVLIGMLVLGPLACASLMSPRWAALFTRFLKLGFAVVAIPVVMALILRVGTTINPLIQQTTQSGQAPSFSVFVMGLALLLMTLWAMTKSAKVLFAWARDVAPSPSLFGRVTGLAGRGLGSLAPLAALAHPAAGAAVKGLGMGIGAAGAGARLGDTITARMVPQGREMSAGGKIGNTIARSGRRATQKATSIATGAMAGEGLGQALKSGLGGRPDGITGQLAGAISRRKERGLAAQGATRLNKDSLSAYQGRAAQYDKNLQRRDSEREYAFNKFWSEHGTKDASGKLVAATDGDRETFFERGAKVNGEQLKPYDELHPKLAPVEEALGKVEYQKGVPYLHQPSRSELAPPPTPELVDPGRRSSGDGSSPAPPVIRADSMPGSATNARSATPSPLPASPAPAQPSPVPASGGGGGASPSPRRPERRAPVAPQPAPAAPAKPAPAAKERVVTPTPKSRKAGEISASLDKRP
jgi:hypothetical protein